MSITPDAIEPSLAAAARIAVEARQVARDALANPTAWEDWCFFLTWNNETMDYEFHVVPFC
jgi:hypothetical protein